MVSEFQDSCEDDPVALSPVVQELLVDLATLAAVFSAVIAFLVEIREDPFPYLGLPVPCRVGMHSASLARDLGLVEYVVNEAIDPPIIYISRVLRADWWRVSATGLALSVGTGPVEGH
ncbi:hypothetical protein KNE206_78840 [Kitasatospora sp. NE20-6]|uniref:hypothetical protein n=1 Tax=Kitasatospora sp. NE20-6 TaxID=2859066 RepID=UPI0034DC38F6